MQRVICQTLRMPGEGIVNYSYLLYEKGSDKAVLVDPAWDAEKIEERLEECGCDLHTILLTHHHFDHVNQANSLARKYGVNVYMSKTEIDHYRFQCENLVSLDAKSFVLAGMEVFAQITPGHTRGSVCYAIGNNLLTGDTLFIEGCGLCNEDGQSAHQMFDSLARLNNETPDAMRVYPGHRFKARPGVTMKYLRNNNPYLRLSRREFMERVTLRNRIHTASRYL